MATKEKQYTTADIQYQMPPIPADIKADMASDKWLAQDAIDQGFLSRRFAPQAAKAQWTAPFKTPRFTTDEFKAAKAKILATEGSTITVPGLEDIIQIHGVDPMTQDEEKAWKKKDWNYFPQRRLWDLQEKKRKSRERYLAMLHSPTPTVSMNAGAILTSLDNAQDALTVMSVLGRIAIKLAPRILGRAIAGPVGWIMTAADILNLGMMIGRNMTAPGMGYMAGKRAGESMTDGNPFSTKARVARAERVKKWFPTKGNLIELAQVTQNVFGVGISLGPIVGLMQDIMMGGIRSILGQPVQFNFKNVTPGSTTDKAGSAARFQRRNTPPHTSPALYPAATVPKAMSLIMASGYQPDDELLMELMTAHYLSQQELFSNNEGWNALDAVQDVSTCNIIAPSTRSAIAQEIIDEENAGAGHMGGWPHQGAAWAPISDIVNHYDTPANDFLAWAMARHNNNWIGHAIGQMATGSHFYTMGNTNGQSQIKVGHTAPAEWLYTFTYYGLYPDPANPTEKLQELADKLNDNEITGEQYNLQDWLKFCQDRNIRIQGTINR